MVSTRKKKNQQKKQLCQLNETLNDFLIGNGTNENAMKKQTLEQQANGPHNNFEKFDNSCSQNQLLGSNTDDKIRNAVENAVIAVDNRMQDAILTAMSNVVNPRVDIAVKSITGLSGNGTNGIGWRLD